MNRAETVRVLSDGAVHTASEAEMKVRVAARELAADGVVSLTLVRPDGAPMPAWDAGAHIDLILDNGLVRQYSLCGDPGDTASWRIAVLLEVEGRGGSVHVHEQVREGSILRVRGPRNHFPMDLTGPVLFIAGGIGITPILPMLRAASEAGCEWQLHYGGRRRSSMAFLDELSAQYGDRVTTYPVDEVGQMDLELLLATSAPAAVFACGPGGLLTAVEKAAKARNVTLHTERFTPRHDALTQPAGSFDVELVRSGLTLTVPAERSILEVVTDAGVSVLSSCAQGTCGTCETFVLAGEVDHRDSILSPEEQADNEIMYICVSRARGTTLSLDL